MNQPSELRVIALPGSLDEREGWLGPDDPAAEAVWLPVVGPACFVLWRRLAQHLGEHGGAMVVAADDLASGIGLAGSMGRQGGLARALRRLQRFGLLWRPREDLVVVRGRLPALDDARLDALRPLIRQLQHGLREVAGWDDPDEADPRGA